MYYSQCEEDITLNENYFKNKRNGTYIELGALDGVLYSNTKFFEDQLGWTGVLIEPHPIQFQRLQQTRPNNVLCNDLVSCKTEPQTFRFFTNGMAAISGIENTIPSLHFDLWFDSIEYSDLPQSALDIKPRTLSEIIKCTNYTHFDLLSLDVEGHEYEVLQSWDFSVPIDVILIEMLGRNAERDELCRQILRDNGYVFDRVLHHNEIWVSLLFK
ncbi:MAG: FkbM family methyltransferase [Flavobacterium sp.]